jgi:hypothetical protein
MSATPLLIERAKFLGIDVHEYLDSSPRQRQAHKMRYIRKLRGEARIYGQNPDAYVAEKMREYPISPDELRVNATLPDRDVDEYDEEDAEDEETPDLTKEDEDEDLDEEDEDLDEDDGEEAEEPVTPERPYREAKPLPDQVVINGQPLIRLSEEKRREIENKVKKTLLNQKKELFPVAAPDVEMQGDTKVYSSSGEESIQPEEDPEDRDGITVGKIREVDDLVGDRTPRTLSDLYARWPIADDPSFFIRIERTKPKRYAGVDVAGYVGEIRGRATSEAEIQRWLGGTEYVLTVYGPDPRGKRDVNDLPIIKPLTDPIKLTVPVLPPNVGAIPAVQGTEVGMTMNGMNPFGAAAPALTNQHDASIHKTNVDYAMNMMKMQKEDDDKKAKQESLASTNLITFLAKSQELQAETIREDARARERLMEKQLEAERAARKDVEAKLDRVERVVEEKTGKGFDVESLSKLLTTVGPNREAESQRQAEYYRMQMETLRNSHEESMKQLRERHNDEMRRSDERLKDNESFYKRMLDDERAKAAERDRDLRAEIDKIRREERDLAAQRLQETKERHESEMRQAEKGHERELRSLREAWDTKMSVAEKTNQMSMTSLQERLREAQEEADRVREEAKESADPVRVMEKAKMQAEAMGFEKKDDAPKTAMDRFMATAGAGLSQALSTINEWGPQMLAARAAGAQGMQVPVQQLPPPGPRGLPPSFARPPQQLRNPGAPTEKKQKRAAVWATENVRPPVQPQVPETPLGFQTTPVTPPAPPEAPSGPVVEAAPALPPETTEVSAAPVEAAQDTGFPPLPAKFTANFSDEVVYGFLLQVENSINGLIDAEVFADQFHRQFPVESMKLAEITTAEEVVATVRAIPGADASPILRRDGMKWLSDMWAALRKHKAA